MVLLITSIKQQATSNKKDMKKKKQRGTPEEFMRQSVQFKKNLKSL
jgi:hypothetical protein